MPTLLFLTLIHPHIINSHRCRQQRRQLLHINHRESRARPHVENQRHRLHGNDALPDIPNGRHGCRVNVPGRDTVDGEGGVAVGAGLVFDGEARVGVAVIGFAVEIGDVGDGLLDYATKEGVGVCEGRVEVFYVAVVGLGQNVLAVGIIKTSVPYHEPRVEWRHLQTLAPCTSGICHVGTQIRHRTFEDIKFRGRT